MFLPAVRSFTNEPVILLWDGLSSHCIPSTTPVGIEFLKLPPGTTSLLQPMDQGIIMSLKRRYRTKILEEILSDIDSLVERQARAARMTAGTAGLKDGIDANVLDVCTIIREQWELMPASTFVNCFVKANILPEVVSNALKTSSATPVRAIPTIEELCSTKGQHAVIGNQQKFIAEVKKWFDVEDDSEIMRLAITTWQKR